jgi:hypothetical protein
MVFTCDHLGISSGKKNQDGCWCNPESSLAKWLPEDISIAGVVIISLTTL